MLPEEGVVGNSFLESVRLANGERGSPTLFRSQEP